jgi:hypothetical protein
MDMAAEAWHAALNGASSRSTTPNISTTAVAATQVVNDIGSATTPTLGGVELVPNEQMRTIPLDMFLNKEVK